MGLNRGQIKKQYKLPARFPLSVTFLSRRILVDREETKSPARRRILATRPIATNKPSTSAAGHRPLPRTAPHKLLAQVEPPRQVDLACSSLSPGLRFAQRLR